MSNFAQLRQGLTMDTPLTRSELEAWRTVGARARTITMEPKMLRRFIATIDAIETQIKTEFFEANPDCVCGEINARNCPVHGS